MDSLYEPIPVQQTNQEPSGAGSPTSLHGESGQTNPNAFLVSEALNEFLLHYIIRLIA